MRVTPARRAALETLRAVRAGELADRALDRALGRVPARERPWTQELTYGTFRLRGRLDHLLGTRVRRGLASLEPDVLDTLRLGAYQLLEMRSVPAYAAVSQAVEMAKGASGRGAGGLVNGVLKALDRDRDGFEYPSAEREPVAFLSTWGSHPAWLVERWVERYGAEGARALVEANNQRPELYIRPIGMEVAEAQSRLDAAGIEAQSVDFAPDALKIEPPAGVREVFDAVPAIVQDPAAGLVIRYTDAPPDARVADLCAAPGGKALALADHTRYVVAADVSAGRLERVRENVERIHAGPPSDGGVRGGAVAGAEPAGEEAGHGNVGLLVADARWPAIREADVVLIDAPCTGTGTLRRHPDGKWRLRPTDLTALVELQREILEAAAPLVVPGGLLIYSTCSLEPEENEGQVDAFLNRHPEFEPVPPSAARVGSHLLDAEGRLTVLPQETGVDGAFAARLRRRG